MTTDTPNEKPGSRDAEADLRYVAWFHELDAWTEYWDIYHPETRGKFYFGDGKGEPGLLSLFLPREKRPPAFVAWTKMALGQGLPFQFAFEVAKPDVAHAVVEVDDLVRRLFEKHFGDGSDPLVAVDYLNAMFRCATNTLPPATERFAKIANDDYRKKTSGHHMIESDLMWFCWAYHLEASQLLASDATDDQRRAIQMAGIASACALNFAWRGHRRTRPEYERTEATTKLLRDRGLVWVNDFAAGAREVHSLFRIREWGNP